MICIIYALNHLLFIHLFCCVALFLLQVHWFLNDGHHQFFLVIILLARFRRQYEIRRIISKYVSVHINTQTLTNMTIVLAALSEIKKKIKNTTHNEDATHISHQLQRPRAKQAGTGQRQRGAQNRRVTTMPITQHTHSACALSTKHTPQSVCRTSIRTSGMREAVRRVRALRGLFVCMQVPKNEYCIGCH